MFRRLFREPVPPQVDDGAQLDVPAVALDALAGAVHTAAMGEEQSQASAQPDGAALEADADPETGLRSSYRSMLGRYTDKTRAIRRLEASGRSDKADKVDLGRHDLHLEISRVAKILGISEEQTRFDMLLSEGNLEELGVRALPIIQLPMVTARFSVDLRRGEEAINASKFEMPTRAPKVGTEPQAQLNEQEYPSQRLTTADGQEVAAMTRPALMSVYLHGVKDEITISGDRSQFEKWSEQPYFVLVYTSEMWSNHIFHNGKNHCDGYTVRTQSMQTLAQDLGLHLFITNDGAGHQDYGSLVLCGVEVPGDRIAEIAAVIRDNPDKYWLTDDELDNPTSVENLLKESDEVLGDGLYVSERALSSNPDNPGLQAEYQNYAAAASHRGLVLKWWKK